MSELLKLYTASPESERAALDQVIADQGINDLESLVDAVDLVTTYFAEQDLIKVEVDDNINGFSFRATLGEYTTPWSSYTQAATIGGFVICTQYFVSEDKALKPMTIQEFIKIIAVS